MSKRILYQSDNELQALWSDGKTLTKIQSFQTSNNGETKFAQYLSDDPKTPIYWLFDTTKEEYQITSLPHVLGKDHHDLMTHKMKRLFEYTPYTYGVIQGRETQGRRDDRVLFTALSNPGLLQPWLNLILNHKVPLVGIFSLPLLSQRLFKYLPKATYTLLVAPTPQMSAYAAAGLRQSFFVNQKLQFSRLIPLNALEPQEYAKYVLAQITITQRYLENARLLPESESAEPLLVVLLTDSAKRHALNQFPNYDASSLKLQILDNHDFARQLGLQIKGEESSKNGEIALYLHHFVAIQLSRSWYTKNHYAKTIDIRYFLYRRVRMGLYFTSGLLLSGAVAASTIILEKANVFRQEGYKTTAKIITHQAKLKQLRQQEPQGLPLDIRLIRSIVDMGDYIKVHHILPHAAWKKLSYVLNRHPNLFIERLEWGVGHSTAEIFQVDSKSTRTENQDSVHESENFLGTSSSEQKFFLEGIRLHGKIHPFKGYQNAWYTFRQFVMDLKHQSNDFTEINVLRSPYNPQKQLQGKIGSETDVSNAPFLIDILIQHNYEKSF